MAGIAPEERRLSARTSAYELCRDLYQRTYAAAELYLVATLQREDQHAAEAAPFFYQRFGGLQRSADRSAA